MKVNKIMKKYIKLSILLALTSSLQLNCAFNAAKRIGKTVCAISLTDAAVRFAYTESHEKKTTALHEAAHAFSQSSELLNVQINNASMNRYSGFATNKFTISSNDDYKRILICAFAGPAQDLHNKNWLERQNFMELELGLPLTRTQKKLSDDLAFLHEKETYLMDLPVAYTYAYIIAEHEILNDLNDESDPIIQKQIEDRVQDLLLQGLQQAKTLVQQNQPQINAIAQALYDKEFLTGDEVRAIIESCK